MADKETKPNGSAFQLPGTLAETRLKNFGFVLEQYFQFQLIPLVPLMPFEEMTVGDLADWIWSTIEKRRERGDLPFEPGHLVAVFVVLRQIGRKRLPEFPDRVVELKRVLPRGSFRTQWRVLQDHMDIKLPRPDSSMLGCFVSLCLAGVIYFLLMFLVHVWGGQWDPKWRRGIEKVCFAAAALSSFSIARLLAPLFPVYPSSCSHSSQLAAILARSNPIPPDSPNAWTRDSVWEVTHNLLARYLFQSGKITRSSRLETLDLLKQIPKY